MNKLQVRRIAIIANADFTASGLFGSAILCGGRVDPEQCNVPADATDQTGGARGESWLK